MKRKEPYRDGSLQSCKCYFVIALVLGIGALFWVSSELHALKDCTLIYAHESK